MHESEICFNCHVCHTPECPTDGTHLPTCHGFSTWLGGSVIDHLRSLWLRKLGDALPVMELPTDHPRPSVQSFRGAVQTIVFPADLTGDLRRLGRREGATLFMTLLAVFKTVLHHYTRQDDLVVGSPSAGRAREDL